MPNTSATGGYLSPVSVAPASDDALADQLQAAVSGITGLDGSLVRPRWQPVPPKQPEPTVDWCAVGVTSIEADTYASIVHDGSGDGSDTAQHHETINVLASFYGPNCSSYAAILRDGLQIEQNREALRGNGIAFRDVGQMARLPALVNQQNIDRVDLPMTFRRQVDRTYAVQNILSAEGAIVADEPAGRPITEDFKTGS